MDKYMLFVGVAISVISIGFIVIATVMTNRSREVEFESDYKARVDAIPPPTPLPVDLPKDDMAVVEELGHLRSIDMRGVEGDIASHFLHIEDHQVVKEGLPANTVSQSRLTGKKVLASHDYVTASISKDKIDDCKLDVQYFYTYRIDQHLKYVKIHPEATISHVRIAIAPGGVYSQPEMSDWGHQDVLVKLDRQDLLKVLKTFNMFIGSHTFVDNYSEDMFSRMRVINIGSPNSVTRRFIPSLSTSLDNISVANFGYSAELASHFVVLNVWHRRHYLPEGVACTWPMVNLTEDIVDEFLEFRDRYDADDQFHEASSFQTYSTEHGFFHIELSHKDADGNENTIIFSDRLSAFNRKGQPTNDVHFQGVAHLLFNAYGIPTDTGHKVLQLDDKRKITWIFNGTINTEDDQST